MSELVVPLAEALAQRQASIANHACPWCGAAAWDTGALAAITLSDDQGAVHFTKDGIPENHRLAFLFVCTACAYTITFYLGRLVVPHTP